MISWLKTIAIRATDVINKLNDPFDDFTRPALPKESKKLWQLENEFFVDLINNFLVCGDKVIASRLPLPLGSPLDLGDQAIWHGIATAVLALRYYFTKRGDNFVAQAVGGLELHQWGHHESKARLIRGVSNDLTKFQDDASNDSATGHLLGIYFGWRYGPPYLRERCVTLIRGLADELVEHNYALIGPTGDPTTYGQLDQAWKTDPLRISLALAVFAVVRQMTGGYLGAYTDLYTRYGALACYPKARLWWLDNQNDTHRAAIHLALLAECTNGKHREEYMHGLKRVRQMTAKDGNIWVNALCRFGCDGFGQDVTVEDDNIIAVKVLSEFTLTDKQYNVGKDAMARLAKYPGLLPGWRYEPVKWGGTYRSNQSLPRWFVRSQDFFWQRNLHSLDVGSEGAAPDSRLNGMDYLAAYWMCRLTGIIDEEA